MLRRSGEKLKTVQRGTANVTQDLGELPYCKRCDELALVCMVKRRLRMSFDQSTSTMWEQGNEERLLEQLWLVQLVLLSHV